ncbi:MAG TPA: DDE-type integrase/transposase/recombinase [Actinophytocola sp.]|nr:DDE-type integrase/transposase/recombinase [Actinophytocola sp.]HEU5474697.1 DDE-type integrase/transposase/recombinase [Actinophytocola sp.]
MSLAAFIADQRTCHRVPHTVACRALGVSQSWFYKWQHRSRRLTSTERRRAELDAAVAEAFAAADGLHGSPRLLEDLRAVGWVVSEKAVAKSMARQGLVARPKKRRKNLTRPDKRAVPFPDLVQRVFTAPAPNVTWVGDMTEIPTDEGKLYLSTAIDLFSRRLLGYATSTHPDANSLVRPSRWPWRRAAGRSGWPGSSSTPTAARPTPRTTSPACAIVLALCNRWVGLVRVLTMPRPNHSSPRSSTRCFLVIISRRGNKRNRLL